MPIEIQVMLAVLLLLVIDLMTAFSLSDIRRQVIELQEKIEKENNHANN